MSKADETRAHIISQAASLFNQRGYAGASMSHIMAATGLKKGGIYNHFSSKDDLAIAAFDFSVQQLRQRYGRIPSQYQGAIAQLQAMIHLFATTLDELPIAGGCPLMNTAIDSDDTHPALRERVQQAMGSWRHLIHRIVDQGRRSGELQADIESDEVATILISTLEGALMMTRLYDDPIHLQWAQTHLNDYVTSLKAHSGL